jgi:hypothetical protein
VLQVHPVDLRREVRGEHPRSAVDVAGEHEPAGFHGLAADREPERFGVADEPVEALLDPAPAGGVEPVHVVAEVGRGEGLAAPGDEVAERCGDAVAPALSEAPPAGCCTLLRPRGADVGLKPERPVADHQSCFVCAVE